MADDGKFVDPRTRANRGRGRGRGRGGRGRGRGNPVSVSTAKPRDLGTNTDRYDREAGESDGSDAYDDGVDFAEVAGRGSGGDIDVADAPDIPSDNTGGALFADFSMLDGVLADAPLWMRLGAHSRFALHVRDVVQWDSFVEPVCDDAPGKNSDVARPEKASGLLGELDALGLSDENEDGEDVLCSKDATKDVPASTQVEGAKDDFDKWLDDL